MDTQRHVLLDAAAAQRSGDVRAAEGILTDALRRDPLDHFAAVKLAEIEIERFDPAPAIGRLERVLRHEPNFAPALAALAQALWLAGRPREGLGHARRAVAIQPPNPHFRLILAQLCMWQGRTAEAREHLGAVLDDPGIEPPMRARALGLLGEWHVARGQFAAANEPYRAALALAPDVAANHMALGINLLRLGDYAPGWAEYAWHSRAPFRRHQRPELQHPPGRRWTGEPLHGRSILLWDDQGYGDAIQSFRYLPLLCEAGAARIVYCTLPPLASLFAASAPFAEVCAEPPPTATDFHCATFDLPAVFGTRLETIPAATPYLRAPPLPRRLRLPAVRLPRVGLAWSGDTRHLRDHQRSIPAAEFLQVADEPALSFCCLQNEVRLGDEPALTRRPQVLRIGERLRNFAETAAVMAALDLVVTVDTAVAHLAGALGRPVWLLLPFVPDWRWLTERQDSPWYPTMRLFRAGRDGWAPVLRRVAEELRDFATQRSFPPP